MDTVYEYRQYLINYLDSMDDEQNVVITIDQFFYLILSTNPCDNDSLLNIVKKIFMVANNSKLSSNIKGLKKLYDFATSYGLSNEINSEIYDLLIIDQLITKNNDILKVSFDSSLASMNQEMSNNYKIKRNNLINKILNQ